MRHRIEFLAVTCMRALLRVLPRAVIRAMGASLGLLFYVLDRPRRRVAVANLTQAFPSRTEAECRVISRAVFVHFGRLLFEILEFSTLSHAEMLTRVEFEGEDRARHAYAEGKGVLFFTGHFGYWELHALVHALRLRPIGVLARALDNPALNRLLEDVRSATGNSVIYRQGAVRRVLKTLAAGEGVALLIDQHMHSPDAIWVSFFGRAAATTSTLAALALRTGAPVVPVFAMPIDGGRYRMIYEHAVLPPVSADANAIRDFTQRCTDVLEMYVRRRPDLWLWMHRRWRDVPAHGNTESTENTNTEDTEDTEDTENAADTGGTARRDAVTIRKITEPMMQAPSRLVIVAPNWLGDAVMALPLVADIHRAWPGTHLTVAGRGSVAVLFTMVEGVDEVIALQGGGGATAIPAIARNATALRDGSFDAALLLPNSFISAWTASRAHIPQRWGVRADLRGALLTRAIKRPATPVHQAEYYQTLGSALGLVPGPRYARIKVSVEGREQARALLKAAGLAPGAPFIAMAPGAAYGRAKQWLPERFAELARLLQSERAMQSVLVGAPADAPVCRAIALDAAATIDLSGRTDLAALAGIFARADAVVANDSGGMHLAAAAGARVVAVFGATNEKKTAPLASGDDRPAPTVVSTDVWCRPCMLRECPIDHRCMTGISARAVFDALALP